MVSEADIASALKICVAGPLTRLAQRLPTHAVWRQEKVSIIMQQAAAGCVSRHVQESGDAGTALRTSSRGRPLVQKQSFSNDSSSSRGSGSKRFRCDLALMCPSAETAAAATAASAGSQEVCVCVGEIKTASQLVQVVDEELQPFNLLDPCCGVVMQLYSYMQVLGICYGELL